MTRYKGFDIRQYHGRFTITWYNDRVRGPYPTIEIAHSKIDSYWAMKNQVAAFNATYTQPE